MKLAWFLYAGLGLALLFGVYESGWARVGGQDWNFFLSQSQAEVTTVQSWGQFPLWAPWRRGGQPCFGQAQSMLLSPVTPLAFAVGVLAAFKLLLLPLFIAGCLGMHALAGQLRLRGLARLVPAAVFFGSSIYPLHVRGGLPNYLFAFALLPWILYALRRARADLRWVALAALLSAGLLLCGAVYQFVFFPLFFLIDATAESFSLRSLRPLLLLGVALLAALALAAPRVLPVADVWSQYPRPVAADESGLSTDLVLRSWLDPELPDITTPQSGFVVTQAAGVYWIYTGAYIGPLALLFAALGLRNWRRTWGWLLAAVVFGWLSLGTGATPSLWDALHRLPVFGSMRFPERQLVLTTFSVALLAGYGFQQFESWVRARLRRTDDDLEPRSAIVLAAIVVPLVMVNAPITRDAFNVEPAPGRTVARSFRQEHVPGRPEQWGGEVYESVLANVGNPEGMSDIPTPPVVRAVGDPGYRGEVYLLGERGAVLAEITPNVITVSAQLSEPDVLVVNQNYFSGWRVEGELPADVAPELVNHDNLLALPLPPGNYHLRLVYAPPGVPRGFLLGGLAVVVVGGWLFARRRLIPDRDEDDPVPGRAAGVGRAEVVGLLALAGVAAGVGASLSAPQHAPLAEELSWVQGAYVVDAAADDEAVADRHAFRDIQSALDAAPAGARVVLHPGEYDGFVLNKPLFVAALSGGPVRVRSAVEVTGLAADERACLLALGPDPIELGASLDVHDGAGLLQLQSVQFPLGVVSVQRWGRVELLGCHVRGTVRVMESSFVAVRTAFRGESIAPSGNRSTEPALAGTDALLLLNECSVSGSDAPSETAAARPGIKLLRSRLVGSSAAGLAWSGGAGAPSITLASSSHARLSGVVLDGAAPWSDASSRLERLQLPSVTLHASRFFGGTMLQLDLTAAPETAGRVVVTLYTALAPMAEPLAWFQCDVSRRYYSEPVAIPASGQLQHLMLIPYDDSIPARGIFVQFVAERSPGEAGPQYSLLDGSLDGVHLPLP